MEELIFCQIKCGLLAPGWCYDVKLESLAVVMMSVLHRFCTENANGPHADPYYSTISPILSCFAQHATAFIFFIESSELSMRETVFCIKIILSSSLFGQWLGA